MCHIGKEIFKEVGVKHHESGGLYEESKIFRKILLKQVQSSAQYERNIFSNYVGAKMANCVFFMKYRKRP